MARSPRKPKGQDGPIDPEVEAQVAQVIAEHGLPPPPPPPPQKPPRIWSRAEVEAQTSFVYAAYVQTWDHQAIYRAGRAQGWPWSYSRVGTLMQRARERLMSGGADDRQVAVDRQRAIERVSELVRYAAGEKDAQGNWARRPDVKATIAAEKLLAELQGTKKPEVIDVNVRHTAAMLQVVANLEGPRGQRIFEEALEQKRLADIARTQLPALVAHVVEQKD